MGIELGSNFDVKTGLPLDSRTKVSDLTARDAIALGIRYEGLKVYVVSEGMEYQLVGGITDAHWVEAGGGGAGGILKVADETERLALVPVAGDYVLQLDTNTLWYFDGTKWLVHAGKIFWDNTNNNAGIGTITPNTTALLDLTSTQKGFLPPRLTTVQRDAITTPATGLFIYNTTNAKYEMFNGAIWKSLTTEEGLSFIQNGFANSGTTGFETYADAPGPAPVNGVGGAANVTVSTFSILPLSGKNSFLLRKDAANRQGQGWSMDFTIDQASVAKVLQIQFDYLVNSGTFVAGGKDTHSDVTIWIYDIDNNVLIQPTTFKLFSNSTTISDSFISNFQTNAGSTHYRLIWHVGSTSALPFELKVGNIKVTRTTYSYGTPITDWKLVSSADFPINSLITASGGSTINTPQQYILAWRRVGGSAEVRCFIITAQPGASVASGMYYINLPSFIGRIDTSLTGTGGSNNLNSSTDGQIGHVGSFHYTDNNGPRGFILGAVHVNSDSRLFVSGLTINSSGSGVGALWGTGSGYFGSLGVNLTSAVGFQFSVPIQGWSAQVQSSDVNDQRIVAARYTMSTNKGSSPSAPLDYDVMDYDTHKAVTTGANWRFTAPKPGFFDIDFSNNSNIDTGIAIYKNGVKRLPEWTTRGATYGTLSFSDSVYLNAGEYIDTRQNAGSAFATSCAISIKQVANPASITSTETIKASYWLPTTGTFSPTSPINFSSNEFDSHGAVTTGASWRFTSSQSRAYLVSVLAIIDSGTYTLNLSIYKNGVNTKCLGNIGIGGAGPISSLAPTLIELKAGDYIDVRPSGSVPIFGGALTTSAAKISIVGMGI